MSFPCKLRLPRPRYFRRDVRRAVSPVQNINEPFIVMATRMHHGFHGSAVARVRNLDGGLHPGGLPDCTQQFGGAGIIVFQEGNSERESQKDGLALACAAHNHSGRSGFVEDGCNFALATLLKL